MSEAQKIAEADATAEAGTEVDGEVATRSPFGRAALLVHTRHLGRGGRAQLRRVRFHREAPPAAFWQLLSSTDLHPDQMDDPDLDRWIYLVESMTRHPHKRGQRPGRVLADKGVAASRIERWLRRDQQTAAAELSRLLSILPAGTSLDWDNLGWLLTRWEVEDRRRFASDFFAQARRNSRNKENANG